MDAKQAEKLEFWFHVLASVLIVTAMAGIATLAFMQAQKGAFIWWAYPAFTLFITVIFIMDWLICRTGKNPR